MIPDIFEVSRIGEGLIYVMPRPSSEWLQDDVKYFSSLEISKIISLLEVSEEYELGLRKEAEALSNVGIEFQKFPIKDRGLPAIQPFVQFISDLYAEIVSGKNLAIHCRAGIGRTGTVSSCLLISDGYSPQVAIEMVSAARGVLIPDTPEQYDFIYKFEHEATRNAALYKKRS